MLPSAAVTQAHFLAAHVLGTDTEALLEEVSPENRPVQACDRSQLAAEQCRPVLTCGLTMKSGPPMASVSCRPPPSGVKCTISGASPVGMRLQLQNQISCHPITVHHTPCLQLNFPRTGRALCI